MESLLKLLILDDHEASYQRILETLNQAGVTVEGRRVRSHAQLIETLGEGGWDAVLADFPLPGVDLLTCLHSIGAQDPNLPVLVVSADIGEEQAVELMKQGVWDFVLKSSLARLLPAIRRTLREAADRRAREEAEHARTESEALAGLIFDTVPEAMLVVDDQGTIARANRAAEAVFGYQRDELRELSVERLIPAAYRQRHRGARAAFAASPTPRPMGQGLNLVGLRRDGSEFPVEISLGPLDVGGRPHVVATIVDITERRRAELLLQRYAQIVETAGELLAFVDADGNHQVVNPAYASLFGKTPDQLRGQPLQVALGEATYQHINGDFAAALNGTALSLSFQFPCPAGEPRTLAGELRPFRSAGTVSGVVLSLRDVSEMRAAQQALEAYRQHLEELVSARAEALRQQTRYLRTLIDGFPFEVWFKDTKSRYLAVNRAAAEAIGIDVRQMVDHTDEQLLPREQAQRYRSDDCEVMASRQRKTVEVQVGEGDQTRWIETYKAPVLDDDGTVLGTVGYARDISARKTLEAVREAALVQAERLARVRSEFLANISHEIRTPLNAILGLARIGQRETRGRRVQDTFARILDSGRHLLAIVNDVLDFSKIEANKLELEEAPFRVDELIDRAVELTAESAFAKGLGFSVEEAPDLPRQCVGDCLRVLQVLVNILSNAVKFTETGSVSLRAWRDLDRLKFEVADTGMGMSADQLDRLFQPFEQADGSTTRRFGGTGLGLAICRRLIDLIGGAIEVSSQLGEGSCFVLSIPLRDAEAAPSGTGGSLVLAGFDPGESGHLLAQLERWQVQATVAEPAEALNRRCDLLVISQPALADFSEADLSHALARDQRIAIVAASAQFSAGLPRNLSQHIGVVTRPLRVRQLLATLRGQLTGTVVESSTSQRLRGLVILAAEDNEINRLILKDLLVHEGASVMLAETGAHAVRVVAARGPEAFDAVLTDVQMPEMDGYETTRQIARVAPGLPVIGLTAYALPEERARCLAAGMVEHISKPIDPDRLVTAILAHCPAGGRKKSPEVTGGALAESDHPQLPILDRNALALRYSGRGSLIEKLIHVAVASSREARVKLRQAADAGDLPSLRFLAHSVKGMAGNLEAPRSAEAARLLETAARDSHPEAPALGLRLSGELQLLEAELTAYQSS
ncbi:MAG: PAS domain S-box protein [Methylococcaceae bacterium]|nr:PAS domain S-box protein [Methylococcaceae bacterium]